VADLIVILASVTVVSLISLIGIFFIGLKEAFLRRVLMALVGFASGSLIGGAFIHLLPEALEETGQAIFYYVIVGIVLFFVMEKFIYWRHCHDEKCPVHVFAYLNLIGDGRLQISTLEDGGKTVVVQAGRVHQDGISLDNRR